MEDDSEQPPPPYEDVIEEDRVKRKKKIKFYSRISFTTINALCSGLVIFGLFLIRYCHVIPVHMLNVTIYCDDPIYNINPIPKQDNYYAYIMAFFLFVIILVVGLIRFKMANLTFEILIKKVVLELWAFSTHLIFLFVAIELIKSATGIPYPYYFANEELKSYYCKPRNDTYSMPHRLKLLDESYRTSFPSYRAAVYAFCITYLYLYVDHYDTLIGLHNTQQYVIIVLGTCSSHLLIGYVEKGENHKMGIVAGLIIGTLQALVAIRNSFGTVVYKRINLSLVALKIYYDANLNKPSNMFELQPLGQNQTDTDATVSTMNNLSCPPSNRCTNNEQRCTYISNIPNVIVNPISDQVVPDLNE